MLISFLLLSSPYIHLSTLINMDRPHSKTL